MDVKSTTSLQDRIKALNLSKIQPISPQKRNPPQTGAEKARETNNEAQSSPKQPRAIAAKRQDTEATKSTPSQELTKKSSWKQQDPPSGSSYHDGIYSMKPSNVPVAQKRVAELAPKSVFPTNTNPVGSVYMSPRRSESDMSSDLSISPGMDDPKASTDLSIYSDTPSNIPINAMDYPMVVLDGYELKKGGSNLPESSLPGAKLTRPSSPMLTISEAKSDNADSDVYMVPRNSSTTSGLTEEVNARWMHLRRTIKDPKLRTMVDMSELHNSSTFLLPSDNIGSDQSHGSHERELLHNSDIDDDTITPPMSPYKRSQSLADNLYSPERKASHMKRPSLPAAYEGPMSPECEGNPFSPDRLSPVSDVSRQSSARSTASSTLSVGSGRARNESNVSVTYEEDNYIAFGSSEGANEHLAPNERTLVIVRGDTEFTGKLTLATESKPQSPVSDDERRTPSPLDDLPSEGRKKAKKLNVFGKLSKAVKPRKKSSPFSSPTSATMPHKKFSQSPGRNMTTSPRRVTPTSPMMTSSPLHVTSPTRNIAPPSPARRPVSHGMFAELKSSISNPSLSTEEEGVYYDPATQDQNVSDDEVITVTTGERDIQPLSFGKRSQSMASLSIESENFGNYRKMSDSNAQFRKPSETQDENEYMVSSVPPVPPPKYKSYRKRTENNGIQSANNDDVTNVASSDEIATNGNGIKLRKPKFTFDKDRKDWPGGRPPSMPMQLPPSPPRPQSMPPDEPPQPTLPLEEVMEENEYVSPSYSQAQEKLKITPQNDRAKAANVDATDRFRSTIDRQLPGTPPRIPFKLKPQKLATNPLNQVALSPETSPDEDGIYHTVDDPVGTTANGTLQKEEKETTGGNRNIGENPKTGVTGRLKDNPFITQLKNKASSDTKPGKANINRITPATPPPIKPTTPPPAKPEAPKYAGVRVGHAPGNNLPKVPKKPVIPDQLGQPDMETVGRELPELPPVKPPPRPLKLAKAQSTQEIPTGPEEIPAGTQNRRESATVAELGKLLAMKSPMSPSKLLKSTPPSPKSLERDGGLFPPVPARPVTPTKPTESKPAISKSVSKPTRPAEPVKPTKPPPSIPTGPPRRTTGMSSSIVTPVTSRATSSPSVHRNIGRGSPTPTAVIIRQHAAGLNTSSVTSSHMISSTLVPASRRTGRRPAKRPTVPPPPRPNVAPPPRPDSIAAQETKLMTPSSTAGKASPPSRPPPPSSEKIKAAEERRKQLASKGAEDVECDYNDMEIKHGEEFNPYAAIDDEAFEATRRSLSQKPTTPTPPARNKHMKRLSSQGFGGLKSKPGKAKQPANETRMIGQNIIAGRAVYNGGEEEERVYAGIDDFDFPQLKHTRDITIQSRNGNFF